MFLSKNYIHELIFRAGIDQSAEGRYRVRGKANNKCVLVHKSRGVETREPRFTRRRIAARLRVDGRAARYFFESEVSVDSDDSDEPESELSSTEAGDSPDVAA